MVSSSQDRRSPPVKANSLLCSSAPVSSAQGLSSGLVETNPEGALVGFAEVFRIEPKKAEWVNKAGVNFNVGNENSVEHAQMVVATNYFGTKNMIQALIPLMKPSTVGARLFNVSSRLGRLNGR